MMKTHVDPRTGTMRVGADLGAHTSLFGAELRELDASAFGAAGAAQHLMVQLQVPAPPRSAENAASRGLWPRLRIYPNRGLSDIYDVQQALRLAAFLPQASYLPLEEVSSYNELADDIRRQGLVGLRDLRLRGWPLTLVQRYLKPVGMAYGPDHTAEAPKKFELYCLQRTLLFEGMPGWAIHCLSAGGAKPYGSIPEERRIVMRRVLTERSDQHAERILAGMFGLYLKPLPEIVEESVGHIAGLTETLQEITPDTRMGVWVLAYLRHQASPYDMALNVPTVDGVWGYRASGRLRADLLQVVLSAYVAAYPELKVAAMEHLVRVHRCLIPELKLPAPLRMQLRMARQAGVVLSPEPKVPVKLPVQVPVQESAPVQEPALPVGALPQRRSAPQPVPARRRFQWTPGKNRRVH